MVERNLNPAGKLWTCIFGAAEIIDGVVRLISCGFFHTRLPLDVSKTQVQVHINKLKKEREDL